MPKLVRCAVMMLRRFFPVGLVLDTPQSVQVEEKRAWYRRDDVAGTYDDQRFGGPSGGHVNERELSIVQSLLPRHGRFADVGCGTGRLTAVLRGRGNVVVPVDASAAMLAVAVRRGVHPVVQGDAFHLPVADGACDGTTAVRFLFHFSDPVPLLRELRRVTRRGGTLVCDTYLWSPRSLLAVNKERWGTRVATVSAAVFTRIARECGWSVRSEVHCFLVSPYIYRRLPLSLVRLLERLERRLPGVLLCRVFWALEAVNG